MIETDILKLDCITKVYESEHTALMQASLAVKQCEFMVLIGPSGSGKTTLLRIIAGLDSPDTGTVLINGTDISGYAPRDRNIAMVMQGSPLYPHFTVEQNIAFALKMSRVCVSTIQQRIRELCPWLRLEHLLKRKPYSLSAGERQRVSLAKALVCRPALFLFDEPLCNIDAEHRIQIRAHLKDYIHQLGISSLYVTHDHSEAMVLADRICVLQQGRIKRIYTPESQRADSQSTGV